MSDTAHIDAPTPPDDPAADYAAHQQAIRILLDAGIQLVQDLAADPTTPPAAKAEPYERLARSIRRTIALARHIAANPIQRAAAAPTAAERRAQARRQVIRDIEDAIEAQAEHPEPAESLRDELNERLDDPEFDRDLATRYIGDIIRDLRRDLGLDRTSYDPHPRRTPADIRDLNARAAAPCKPPPEPDLLDDEPEDPEPEDFEFEDEPDQTLGTRYRDAADG